MRTLLQTPLLFEVLDDVVHCPMLRATVAGVSTLLILDTGATDHVLTIELAQAAKLQAMPDEPGTDHAGAEVPSWLLDPLKMSIDQFELQLGSTIAIAGPAPFEHWGVGGFLSPHRLAPDAWTVLDLIEDRFWLIEATATEFDGWVAGQFPTLHVLSLPRDEHGVVAVQAAIQPHAAVATIVNTGGQGTEFATSVVPGLCGDAELVSGYGLSGAAVGATMVADQVLTVDGASFPLEELLVRDAMPEPHGIIGMDVLDDTVICIGPAESMAVRWLVPPAYADA